MNKAGPQPPYHTTNATAENIVASGNDPPIHGVNAARIRIAAAMARSAIPYLEIVEEACRHQEERTGIVMIMPVLAVVRLRARATADRTLLLTCSGRAANLALR